MGNQIDEVRNEMVHLLDEQVNALETETYMGWTDEESRQYDERQARIHQLSEKIRDLAQARLSNAGFDSGEGQPRRERSSCPGVKRLAGSFKGVDE